ncbi:hypothetical protein BDW59DRAFT_86486 [Aspergillus cavernicola]|uniref:NACHT domain-containing protein n=1 Tax=Aspergillus cavernicola TaxID=176166 RepID=A0ABR4I9D8_9EURO
MDPLSAFGLAAGVIQITHFTGQLIRGIRNGAQSADGLLVNNASLKEVAETLLDLTAELAIPAKSDDLSPEEKLLQQLGLECQDVSNTIIQRLKMLQESGSSKKWDNLRQSFSQILGQKETKDLETKLGRIREQLNTTLLICLRNQLARLQEKPVGQGRATFISQIQKGGRRGQQWQSDILLAIHRNDWDVNNEQSLAKFTAALDDGAEIDRESQFGEVILTLLDFPDLPDRHKAIPIAHRKTFEWIYYDSPDFANWLLQSQVDFPFWVTGKPGSGKSTLMKFLYDEPRTRQYLEKWAGSQPLVLAGFFFWSSGTIRQMSQRGLLLSLLFQVLQSHPEYTRLAFPSRWKQYNLLRGGLHDWTIPELQQALETIASQESFRFAFFIDGLDEFDGDLQVLVELVGRIATKDNTKLCVSSRPWNLFQDAFDRSPSLLLEQLTHSDIQLYVFEHFRKNRRFVKLLNREPDKATELEAQVVDKACGVFLWVYLVVPSLREGIRNGDSIADLQRRLDALPSDLEELFEKLLSTVDTFYFRPACHLMQLVRQAYAPLDLLTFYYTDDAVENALTDPIRPLDRDQKADLGEEGRRRLNSRCKGILEAPNGKIQYLHRTAKDFLHSPGIWSRIVAGSSTQFDANHTLASAYLCHIKSLGFETMREDLWTPIIGCLEHSVQGALQRTTDAHDQIAFLRVLDTSVGAVVNNSSMRGLVEGRPDRWPRILGFDYPAGAFPRRLGLDYPINTFLELCVRLNILPFIRYQLEANNTAGIDKAEYIDLLSVARRTITAPSYFAAARALSTSRFQDPDTVAVILESCPHPEWIVGAVQALRDDSQSPELSALLSAYLLKIQPSASRLRQKMWFRRLRRRWP